MNSNVIENMQARIAKWIEDQIGPSELWGLGIDPFFSISQSTFAIRVLLWNNNKRTAELKRKLKLIAEKLLSDEFPKYTRSYSWFVYLFADEIYEQSPNELKKMVEIIISLKNDDGGWGHGKSGTSRLNSGDFHILPTSLAILALSKSASYIPPNIPIIKEGVKLIINWLNKSTVNEIALKSIALLAIYESQTHDVNVEFYSKHIESLKSELSNKDNLRPLTIANAAGNLDTPYYLHTPAWGLVTLSAIGDNISTLENKLFLYHHLVKLVDSDGAVRFSESDKDLFIYKAFNVYFAFKQFSESVSKDRLLDSIINDPDAIKKLVINNKKKTRLEIFIGSSTEGLDVARKIKAEFEEDSFDAILWTQNVFRPSSTPIESLENALEKFDFALLVLTPDDIEISRGIIKPAVRDNVLFELGLFIGKLSRNRVFMVHPRNIDIKIPTDLLGVKPETYDDDKYKNNPQAAIGTACDNIRNEIMRISKETVDECGYL